jgi:anti-anti-sigma regulatory factor
LVLEISGDCHFAASGLLLERVESSVPPGARDVVLDLSHAHALRFAALLAFEKLSRDLKARGARLWLAGVDPDFAKLLSKTGSHLPAEPYVAEPSRSVRSVLARIVALHADGDPGAAIDGVDTNGHT